jgi:L-iduronidase
MAGIIQKNLFSVLLAGISVLAGSQDLEKINFNADLGSGSKNFPHYWKSTGFTPADLMDYPDMEMTLDYIKASGAIEFIRPHYLLDHVRIRNFGLHDQEIDWSGLDAMLDKIVEADLKPIFEIMGNPLEREIDFADENDLYAWKDFVRDLARHYADRYGEEIVESWLFETSNEPDLSFFWEHGFIKFLNYYDACSEGLKEANPDIRFGGPGTALGASPMFKVLLEHCAWGKNYFTGETGVRIDFISTHRKNIPHHMIKAELEVWNYIENEFPEISKRVPVVNDEADPIAGWARPYFWRTGPWYAAFILQTVELHNRLMLDSLAGGYALLGNDHGFLGSWEKRTLTTRFIPGDNDRPVKGNLRMGGKWMQGVERDEWEPVSRFFLIKKPALTVMSLMSLFGDTRFDVEGMDDEAFPNAGAIVSRNGSGDVITAIFNKPEMQVNERNFKSAQEMQEIQKKLISSQGVDISLHLAGLENGKYRLVHYRLDEKHGHAYSSWLEMGSPEDITLSQYNELAAAMEPAVIDVSDVYITTGEHDVNIKFPASGVSFVILAKDAGKTGQVKRLSYKKYLGLNGEDVIMLNWEKCAERGVLGYEVYAKAPEESSFKKVNPTHLFATGYAHVTANSEGYQYKVRKVDYWERKGKYSDVLTVE